MNNEQQINKYTIQTNKTFFIWEKVPAGRLTETGTFPAGKNPPPSPTSWKSGTLWGNVLKSCRGDVVVVTSSPRNRSGRGKGERGFVNSGVLAQKGSQEGAQPHTVT